ncbi:MAG: LysR family transcriptional regulator [Mycobacteriales bacterium]
MSTPDLRELRAFLVVAEELHFGRAAGRLGLTPSRVSQTIRQLERRVGGRLFERTSRRVSLTPAGDQLRRDATAALAQLEDALARTRTLTTGVAGTLRIGMYSRCNAGPRFLEIVKEFTARHPSCPVEIVDTGLDRDQFDWLRRRDADLLAMRLPLHDPALVIGPLLSREPRVLLVARDHPLATRDSVCVDDFAEYPIQLPATLPREMLDDFVPPRSPSGRPMRRIFRRVGSIGDVTLRIAVGELVHATVASFTDHYHDPAVTAVPIRDLPASRTALVWLADQQTPAHEALAAVAADLPP